MSRAASGLTKSIANTNEVHGRMWLERLTFATPTCSVSAWRAFGLGARQVFWASCLGERFSRRRPLPLSAESLGGLRRALSRLAVPLERQSWAHQRPEFQVQIAYEKGASHKGY